MTPFPPIHFTAIDRSTRIRTQHNGIPELAESITHNGLIQPLVLSPKGDDTYLLNAGGRRSEALATLLSAGLWDGFLHHGVTSTPGRYGYVLKEETGTELSNLLTEIAENLDRQDLPWQDNLKGIVKAARLLQREAAEQNRLIVQRDLGAIIGCGYQDLRAALAIYDDFIANPKDYELATTIRNAYQVLLTKQTRFVEKLYNDRTLIVAPKPSPSVEVQSEPKQEEEASPVHVPLTSNFFNTDWRTAWQTLPQFDHIVTDPDYALSPETLAQGVGTNAAVSASGVAQLSIDESLSQMRELIRVAFALTRGYFVFFYDLDHHEKLKAMTEGVGFAVQRWPLIWHKLDYRSNAAPSHNFCKNVEYAMVCRKPGATLAVPGQMSSIFSCNAAGVARDLGHPFAKPSGLWQWIFKAICHPGQTVWDPCCGVGSMPLAALEMGLCPSGCEVSPDHYNRLLVNLQAAYTRRLGSHVTFS